MSARAAGAGWWYPLLILMSLAASGCPSTSLYRTADPMAKGQWQVGAAADLGVMVDTEQENRFSTANLELSVRRGVSDNADLGLKLSSSGAELNGTVRLLRRRWSVALAPQLSMMRARDSAAGSRALHLFAGVALIMSRPLSKKWTLGTGPLLGYGLYQPETGGKAEGAWLGAFVHLQRAVGRHWRFTPELGAYQVVLGEVPVRGRALRIGAAWQRDL